MRPCSQYSSHSPFQKVWTARVSTPPKTSLSFSHSFFSLPSFLSFFLCLFLSLSCFLTVCFFCSFSFFLPVSAADPTLSHWTESMTILASGRRHSIQSAAVWIYNGRSGEREARALLGHLASAELTRCYVERALAALPPGACASGALMEAIHGIEKSTDVAWQRLGLYGAAARWARLGLVSIAVSPARRSRTSEDAAPFLQFEDLLGGKPHLQKETEEEEKGGIAKRRRKKGQERQQTGGKEIEKQRVIQTDNQRRLLSHPTEIHSRLSVKTTKSLHACSMRRTYIT